MGQSNRNALKVGSSGGRSSKTNTVISTANTPSENALNRSVVALARNTIVPFIVHMIVAVLSGAICPGIWSSAHSLDAHQQAFCPTRFGQRPASKIRAYHGSFL